MRNMWMIACFTEDNNSKMWAQYANNFSGICLVYSFFDVLETIKHTKGMSIMPVRYVDNRDKYKDICLNHKDLLEFNDETEPKYQLTCTTKEKLSYSFEEEWRLIYEERKSEYRWRKKGDCIPFINPAVIICGNSVDNKFIRVSKAYKDSKGKRNKGNIIF